MGALHLRQIESTLMHGSSLRARLVLVLARVDMYKYGCVTCELLRCAASETLRCFSKHQRCAISFTPEAAATTHEKNERPLSLVLVGDDPSTSPSAGCRRKEKISPGGRPEVTLSTGQATAIDGFIPLTTAFFMTMPSVLTPALHWKRVEEPRSANLPSSFCAMRKPPPQPRRQASGSASVRFETRSICRELGTVAKTLVSAGRQRGGGRQLHRDLTHHGRNRLSRELLSLPTGEALVPRRQETLKAQSTVSIGHVQQARVFGTAATASNSAVVECAGAGAGAHEGVTASGAIGMTVIQADGDVPVVVGVNSVDETTHDKTATR